MHDEEEDDVIERPAGTRLRWRLERNQSRGGQLGCTLFCVLLLGTLSFFLLRYPMRHPEEDGLWLMYVVGGGFGLVAVLLFFLGFVQRLFALITPETLVEIDTDVLRLGERASFFLRQPGGGSYESLRMNLVAEERVRQQKTWTARVIETINLFDSGPFEGDGAVPFERTIAFEVPPNLERTSGGADRQVHWQLEVWGKIRGRADFQHVYEIHVLPPLESDPFDHDHV